MLTTAGHELSLVPLRIVARNVGYGRRLASNMKLHLVLFVVTVVLTACGSRPPQHSEFTIGMSRSEILEKFGDPQRRQSLTKSGEAIWGAIEEFWPHVPQGARVEIWGYESRMVLKDGASEFDQLGQTELYFVNDSDTVSGIGFHIKGAVYEAS